MPCDWPLSYLACTSTEALNGLSPEEKAQVEEMATRLLWNWTGRRFGICDGTIRPCRVLVPSGTARFLASLVDGTYRWAPTTLGSWSVYPLCGDCGAGSCGCSSASLRLPLPVQTVTAVRIDGEVLDPEDWWLDGRRTLVRLDGYAWPTSQDLDAPPGSPGTWEVDVTYGEPVPDGGQIAAGLLAAEMAKALCGDNTCQLPRRVQSITRQGVSVTMLDGFEDLDKGRTGVWLVDSWVSSETTPTRGGRVLSVDVARGR